MVKYVSNLIGTIDEEKPKYNEKIYDDEYNILKFQNKALVNRAKSRGIKVDNPDFSGAKISRWENFLPSYNGADYRKGTYESIHDSINKTIENSKTNSYNPDKQVANVLATPKKSFWLEAEEKTKENNQILRNIVTEPEKRALEDQYYKTANAYVNYMQQDIEENYDPNLWDKTGGRFVNGLTSPLNTFRANWSLKNANGEIYKAPTRTDFEEQKISESYGDGFLGKIGKFAGDVLYQGGKLATSAGLNAVTPGLGTAVYFSDIAASNYNQAKAQGYSGENALFYSAISTAAEFATGKLLGGTSKAVFGKNASSELSKSISNVMTKAIKNNPKVVSAISNAISEGGEEFLQEYVDKIVRNVVLDEKEGLNAFEGVFTQESFENALYSAAIGATTGGISGSMNSDSSNTYEGTLNTRIAETNNDILKYNNRLSNVSKLNDKLPNINTQNITNKINSKIAQKQDRLAELTTELDNYTSSRQNTLNPAQNDVNNVSSLSANNPNEIYVPQNSENIKINNFRQSIVNNNLNNSEKAQGLYNVVEKIINDKNYNITFDSSIVNDKSEFVNAKIENINGEVSIKINPNSERAGEFLLVHEITHAIENDSMKNLVMDYAKANYKFNEALESLKQTYRTDDVSSEVLADISGQLFGNQEFISDLSMKQPNIFKRFYNTIVSLANKITGNSHEALFIKDLKNKWENAYRTQNNNLNGTQYHTSQNIETDINNVLTNISERNPVKLRDYTPSVLVQNGIEDLPMYQNPAHIRKNILTVQEASNLNLNVNKNDHYHGLGKELYIKVIDSLDTPRAIFKKNNSNDYIILTSIKDSDGNNIIVPVEIETTTNVNNIKIDTNRIKTLYGKTSLNEYIKKNLNTNDFQKVYEQKKERGTGLLPAASSFYADNIPQSNNNVKSDISSTKYSMQENTNNTQELGNSSFSLTNGSGKKIDISSLQETPYMKQFTFNRKYNKGGITTYRGVGEEGGTGITFYGLGLYTTLDKSYARKYGNVTVVDNSLLPNNPLHFKTQNDFKIWEQELAKQLGIRRSELYGDYGVEQYLNKLGYDGLMIGTGKDTDLISFTNSAIKYSQNSDKWQEHLENNYKATGTRTDMGDIKNKTLDKSLSNNNVTNNEFAKENTSEIAKLKGDELLESKFSLKKNKPVNENTKVRTFSKSVTESEGLDQKVIEQAMKDQNYTYVPDSNRKQVQRANQTIESLGFEKALEIHRSNMSGNKRLTADDVVLAERLLQEASKKNDIKTSRELLIDTAILGTETGQMIQALSIIKKLSPEGQLMILQKTVDRMKKADPKRAGNMEITDGMVETILNSKNAEELNNNMDNVKQELAEQLPPKFSDKVVAWRYLSMLGNPKTHIRNIVSNIAMKETKGLKDTIAAATEDVFGKYISKKGQERSRTLKKSSDDVKAFVKNYSRNISENLGQASKYSVELEIKKAQKVFGDKGLGKFVQYLYDKNSSALEIEDAMFKNSAYKKAMANYLTANGIKTSADIDANPNLVNNAHLYATEESLKATFQQYSGLATMLNNMKRKNKAGEFLIDALVPFTKTPANILKTGAAYSPLGLAKSITVDTTRLLNNKITISQYIDNISQGLTGSGIFLLGYALSSMGMLSASGEDDKEGKYDENLGNQGYSLKIGNQTFTLDWLSPVAMPLFAGAEMQKTFENKPEDIFSVDGAINALTTTFDPLMEMSLMQSLNSALSGFQENKLKGMVEQSISSYVGQFIPTAFGQVAKTIDPTIRSTSVSKDSGFTLGEQILRSNMAKIPGLTYLLEPATDIWGNEKQRSDNIIARAFENAIAPYSRKTIQTTKIDDELKSIYSKTSADEVIPKAYLNKYVNYKGEKYETDAKSYTQFKKTYGTTAYNTLEKLFETSTYKNANDEDKVKLIEEAYDYASDISKKEFLSSKDIIYTNSEKDGIDVYKENNITQVIKDDISLAAVSYKEKNPSKYAAIVSTGMTYDDYDSYAEKVKEIKDKYPGKDNSKVRKEKIFEYVNGLNISKANKILLFKGAANYGISAYKSYMWNYIENLKISKKEKQEIWDWLYE